MKTRTTSPGRQAKETGLYWLGTIPHTWRVLRNGALFDERDDRGRDDLPILSVSLVTGVEVRDFSSDYIQPVMSDLRDYKVAAKGDIVFNKMRMWQGAVGTAPVSGLVSPDYTVLRPRHGVDARFFTYVYRTPGYNCEVGRYSHGIALDRNRIYWDEFKVIPAPAPPSGEQTGIADFLDRKTAVLDALLERKERLVALLHEKRQALVTEVITKGLDPSVPLRESGIDWLGRIPAHWIIQPLMHLTPAARPIMYGIVLPGPDVEGGVPIVKGGNVAPGRLVRDALKRTTADIEARFARARLAESDVVFAIRGSVGAAELVPRGVAGANITQDVARVAPSPGVDPRWLLHSLRAEPAQTQAAMLTTGATVRGLNIGDLKRILLAVPPRAEQLEIADYIDRAVSPLEQAAQRLTQTIALLREYRQALITAAVTGKLDLSKEAC